jgi:hypothetical protein
VSAHKPTFLQARGSCHDELPASKYDVHSAMFLGEHATRNTFIAPYLASSSCYDEETRLVRSDFERHGSRDSAD